MPGCQLVASLRAEFGEGCPAIIILSGEDEAAQRRACPDASGYLVKPFHIHRIVEVLNEWGKGRGKAASAGPA
jgi:DNA-binding response OmpR family regulator